MTSAPTFFNSATGHDWKVIRRVARRQPGSSNIFADTNNPVEQRDLMSLFRPCPACGLNMHPFRLSRKSKYRRTGQRIYFSASCGAKACRTSAEAKALRAGMLKELKLRDAELARKSPTLFDTPEIKGKAVQVFETPETRRVVKYIATETGLNMPIVRRRLLEHLTTSVSPRMLAATVAAMGTP